MHIASKKKVYISGPITKDPNFKEHFDKVAEMLTLRGFVVMNPAILPAGFEYEDYMVVCFAMIDVSEIMCFLEGWDMSPGAEREKQTTRSSTKRYTRLCTKTKTRWSFPTSESPH